MENCQWEYYHINIEEIINQKQLFDQEIIPAKNTHINIIKAMMIWTESSKALSTKLTYSPILTLTILAVLTTQLQWGSCMTFLDKSRSYAIYDSWDITEAGKLELTFKTQSSYCVILYVDSKSLDGSFSSNRHSGIDSNSGGDGSPENESFLHVALERGTVIVTLQIASEKNTRVVRIGNDLNNLEWHRLVIAKFVGTLQVEVDDLQSIVNYPNDLDEKFRIESRLYVGGLSEKKGDQESVPNTVKYMTR